MAIKGTNALTLADHAKRMDPDGKIPQSLSCFHKLTLF